MSKTLEQIVDDLSALSVLDMSKLKTLLEDKWGVKAAAAAPMMMAAAPAAAAPAAAEATEFEVTLGKAPDDKKIGVIKVVREITGLGLKEAKDIVDAAPKVLKASCNKTEADEIVKKVTAAGGQATVKGL
ncbi:MAG TPA: 50S ribosomal protein L7/L12 [Rhabdochlamydiaceae bacterium]|nr:50S ribosomal protein L7/L12 [Rhabdochlamydiaceae bacterium]